MPSTNDVRTNPTTLKKDTFLPGSRLANTFILVNYATNVIYSYETILTQNPI